MTSSRPVRPCRLVISPVTLKYHEMGAGMRAFDKQKINARAFFQTLDRSGSSESGVAYIMFEDHGEPANPIAGLITYEQPCAPRCL